MLDILGSILTNVLLALYEPFGFAVLMAALAMFFYLYMQENGGDLAAAKKIIKKWKDAFLHDRAFRRFFLLAFYTAMILFRTLLNRDLWLNPLSKVLGGWTLMDENGELSTEPIENLFLFIPFSVLLMWALKTRLPQEKMDLPSVLKRCTGWVFAFALVIELLQLLLRVGTFQLSDFFYNTLGGFLGGLLYWLLQHARRTKDPPSHPCKNDL